MPVHYEIQIEPKAIAIELSGCLNIVDRKDCAYPEQSSVACWSVDRSFQNMARVGDQN